MQTKLKFNPTQEMLTAAKTVFVAMAWEGTVRPVVKKYEAEILEQLDAKNKRTGEPIRDAAQCYLIDDETFQKFLKIAHDKHLEHGFKVPEFGYCPLLMAENTLRKAQNCFIDAMQPITKIAVSDLWNMKHRAKLIDLSLKLLAPFINYKRQS